MYLFKQSWPFETVSSSALHAALAQDSSVQPDFLNKDFRYALEALSLRPSEDCLSFLLASVGHSKKYSSGFSSLLTLQDSDGEILQDSNGVLMWWWWGFGGAFEPLASEEGDEEGGVFPCRRVHQLGMLLLLCHEKLKTFGTQTLCSVVESYWSNK
ncbi:hypothetical protein NC651_035411 [Populus alba x Populus x berolinensis]|nr:hypothetical protein NC651_035411 [Populus alba x Populus x berolinensis]